VPEKVPGELLLLIVNIEVKQAVSPHENVEQQGKAIGELFVNFLSM
jgi:hypothetical protein